MSLQVLHTRTSSHDTPASGCDAARNLTRLHNFFVNSDAIAFNSPRNTDRPVRTSKCVTRGFNALADCRANGFIECLDLVAGITKRLAQST
jgi:hypothetical protein